MPSSTAWCQPSLPTWSCMELLLMGTSQGCRSLCLYQWRLPLLLIQESSLLGFSILKISFSILKIKIHRLKIKKKGWIKLFRSRVLQLIAQRRELILWVLIITAKKKVLFYPKSWMKIACILMTNHPKKIIRCKRKFLKNQF